MSFMKMFMKKIGLFDQEYMNQINSGKYSESKICSWCGRIWFNSMDLSYNKASII